MKRYQILSGLAALTAGMWLQSCSNELEFADAQGELKVKMIVSNELTRSESDNIAESLILHIANEKGVLYQFKGMQELTDKGSLWLKCGAYTAKAWMGDSVSASFDKKAYSAVQPFEIQQGVNNVAITCRVANVVASVNPEGVPSDVMKDWTVTVFNSRASLDFTAENWVEAHGYFMQPWTETGRESTLKYAISGKTLAGTDFRKEGTIEGVQPTHEYVLRLKFDSSADPTDVGGAFLKVIVDDSEILIEDEVVIEAAPRFGALNFDLDKGVSGSKGTFSDMYITGVCYGEPKHCILRFSDRAAFGMDYDGYDFVTWKESASDELANKNISWNLTPDATGNYTQMRLTLPASLLNSLENGSYYVELEMTDGMGDAGRTRSMTIPIEVSDAKVKVATVDLSAVRTYSAPITLLVLDDDATNPGIRFREKGSTTWTEAVSAATRTGDRSFQLTNLTPSTTYQVQAFCDGYENSQLAEFTTEAAYVIPNASFEDWSTTREILSSKDVIFPGTGSTRTFWDSGNHGSMSLNKSTTTSSSDIKHSGSYSARLESLYIVVKFAAGNMFAGTYDATVGTSGGKLTLGRPMDKCHPLKFTGYANYRPQTVEYVNGGDLNKGDMDEGIAYVAIVSAPVKIDNSVSPPVLLNPAGTSDYKVLAYGEKRFVGNFGADGQMEAFEAPLQWTADSQTYDGPYYVVIMFASSRNGDYFSGGKGSVLYVDDVAFTYE